jgi:DNA adenine methylase
MFERLKRKQRKTLCDKLYISRHSYNSFGGSYRPGGRISKKSEKYREKLKGVQITGSDWKTVMKRHNRKGTFFFIDPPYHIPRAKEYYHKTKSHHPHPREVCECARKSRGKVMITYNDHPEVRRACRGLNMRGIKFQYSASSKRKIGKELIITNY